MDYLLKKHFDDDSECRPLILELAEYDPSPKKKYLAWLVKHWTGTWSPDEAELKRMSGYLTIHLRGAKYFSPLTWTGLRLEEAGYQADIFRYTPRTLASLKGAIEEIIRTDEEDKQIRKGNREVTGGAEVAYQDERWTLLRIRDRQSLRRLGQGTSWCVADGDLHDYRFPFDFLVNSDGERFLACGGEIADRWDRWPSMEVRAEIERVRQLAADGLDRATNLVEEACNKKQRLEEAVEERIIQYPQLAVSYATEVINGPWPEFESHVRVADMSAGLAAVYAINCRREPWPRFENKIRRCKYALAWYREAFPEAIPKTDEEIFKEKLEAWRSHTAIAGERPSRYGVQLLAEARERNTEEERSLLRRNKAIQAKYAKLLISLAHSELESWYREKLGSYFDFDGGIGQSVNLPMARLLCRWFRQRNRWLEPMIATDAVCSLNYAMAIKSRFTLGEPTLVNSEFWEKYHRRFLAKRTPQKSERYEKQRVFAPSYFKVAWR